MSELSPCPFCGQTEMLRPETHSAFPDGGVTEGWIECINCGARGQTEYGSCDPSDMDRLLAHGWNARSLQSRVKQLEEALRKLANEVGAIAYFEAELRQVMGHTNWNVLRHWHGEAERVLNGGANDPA